jgi:WD40 repeat protein
VPLYTQTNGNYAGKTTTNYLHTRGNDLTARIWNTETGREMKQMTHTSMVNSAIFSSDGKKVVTASHDGIARIWDLTK